MLEGRFSSFYRLEPLFVFVQQCAARFSRPAFSELGAKLERGVETINEGAADQLEARIITPMGELVVRNLLLTQLGHVPYHCGQIKMTAKQLE